MLEIFFLIYFSRKIHSIAIVKGLSSAKWIATLFLYWFAAESAVFLIGMAVIGVNERMLMIFAIPAIVAGSLAATVVIKRLKSFDDEESTLSLDEFAKKDDNDFKHFR